MLLITNNRRIMGEQINGRALNMLCGITLVARSALTVGLLVSFFNGFTTSRRERIRRLSIGPAPLINDNPAFITSEVPARFIGLFGLT
jgi:hypothetical protein